MMFGLYFLEVENKYQVMQLIENKYLSLNIKHEIVLGESLVNMSQRFNI